MTESFYYCDEVTIAEELVPSRRKRYNDVPMHVRCIDNAFIIPYSQQYAQVDGEVMTSDGQIIPEVCSGTNYSEYDGKTFDVPDQYESGEEIIYLGALSICWGHYITDGICKLWCLQTNEFQTLIGRGVPVVFCSQYYNINKMPTVWRHLVDLLGGADIKIRPLNKITKFNKIYIPTNSIQNQKGGRYYTNEFIELVSVLKNNALKNISASHKVYDKIYLSRTKLVNDHAEFGERSLENVFKSAGFHILYPEQLSFEQQVYCLANAKMVAGTMGSISHNFMFCSPETEVIILRKAWYTNDFQYVINQVARLNCTYIDANLSVFLNENSNTGPFFLYINDNVRRFFLERFKIKLNNSFNRRLFKLYIMHCIQKPRFNDRNVAPVYYYEKMFDELNSHLPLYKRFYRNISLMLNGKIGLVFKSFVRTLIR